MTAANMPILYQNIMAGLPSDLARDAFLFASERTQGDPMLYKAEAFAREVDGLVKSLAPMLDCGAKQHGRDAHDPDLMRFILKRHANWRFDGNVSPEYAGVA
jgi:hypothetical protein